MGILDSIEGMAGQQSDGSNAKVAGGLMQALDKILEVWPAYSTAFVLCGHPALEERCEHRLARYTEDI